MRLALLAVLFGLATTCLASTASESAPSDNKPAVESIADIPDDGAGASKETFHFQAEVNRMMKLIVHSLYKSKEVSAGQISNRNAYTELP